ncbi:hypothetical protein H4R19_004666, partial [Coemansia spiralis]
MDAYSAGMGELVSGSWTSAAVIDALVPAVVAGAAWCVLPATVRRLEGVRHPEAWLSGSDNRAWIGPLVVALALVQALAQAAALWTLCTQQHRRVEALAAAALLAEWVAAAVVAARQLRAYLASDRRRHYGLFAYPLLAFAAARLCAELLQAYHVCLGAPAAVGPRGGGLLLTRLAASAAMTVLLLGARRLPRPGPPVALPDTGAGPTAAVDEDPRLLAADTAPHRLAPELGASILGNLLFCWAGEAMAVSSKRQLQLDDLCDPPPHHSQAAAWARFHSTAAPGRSLGRQVVRAFWPALAAQAVLNPACVVLDYAQPFIMQRLLRFVAAHAEGSAGGVGRGFGLAVAMLAASVAATFASEQQMWQARQLGSALRSVLVVLLGSKTLRRPTGGGGRTSSCDMAEGRVHSVLTADLARMARIWNPLDSVLLLPARLAVGAWYMYQLLGSAGLLGTALVGLAVWLTRRLVARARHIEAELGVLNDRRLALVGEVVRGIAAIKLSGWGPRFVRAIDERRGEQLCALRAWARAWSLINLSTQGALPLAMFAALAAYG